MTTLAGQTTEAAGATKTNASLKALAARVEVIATGTLEIIHFWAVSGTSPGVKFGVLKDSAGVPGTFLVEDPNTSAAAAKVELTNTGAISLLVEKGEFIWLVALPLGGSVSWKPGSTTTTIAKGNTESGTVAASAGHYAAATTEGPIGFWATGTLFSAGIPLQKSVMTGAVTRASWW